MMNTSICTRLQRICISSIPNRLFSLTSPCNHVQMLSRLRVVDNSEIGKRAMAEGKPPKLIKVYGENWRRFTKWGHLGDRVLVAIKGEMKRGILVGLKQVQNHKVPKFDSNNVVLIDDTGSPLGTRIHVPIPTILRTMLKDKPRKKGVVDLYTQLNCVSTASYSELKQQYYTLIRRFHPDKSNLKNYDEFRNIVKAWRILRDESLRKEYDSQLVQENFNKEEKAYEILSKSTIKTELNAKWRCRCGTELNLPLNCDILNHEEIVIECDNCSNSILIQ